MVRYTLAQSPDLILSIPGKDSRKARDKALDQLVDLMDEGELPIDLTDGFGPHQFIEVTAPNYPSETQNQEDAVVDAVQVLSHLATLKVKVQASRTDALQVRELVDLLFSDEPIDEGQLQQLKDGFKTLKSFAQSNLKYREAKLHAESARQVLDEALK